MAISGALVSWLCGTLHVPVSAREIPVAALLALLGSGSVRGIHFRVFCPYLTECSTGPGLSLAHVSSTVVRHLRVLLRGV